MLVIIFPEWSQFKQTAKDLEMNLDAMDTNIKVANINREIHKVRIFTIKFYPTHKYLRRLFILKRNVLGSILELCCLSVSLYKLLVSVEVLTNFYTGPN